MNYLTRGYVGFDVPRGGVRCLGLAIRRVGLSGIDSRS